jgi:hypothetical protein
LQRFFHKNLLLTLNQNTQIVIPIITRSMPPSSVTGYISPYLPVVTIITASQAASPMLLFLVPSAFFSVG